DQLLAAIADLDAPEARHAVEDAVAVAVGDVAALGMGDDPAAAERFDLGPVGLGGQMVCDVEALEFGDVVIAGHVSLPGSPPFEEGVGGGWDIQGKSARLRLATHP